MPGGKKPSEWTESGPVLPPKNCGTTMGMICVLQSNSGSCRVTGSRPTMRVKERGLKSKPEAVGVGKLRVAWGNRRELCGDGSNEESQADTLDSLDVVARMRDHESYAG